MRNKRKSTDESAQPSENVNTGESDALIESSSYFSSINAADMLSQYKNASLEFGTGNKSCDYSDEGTQKLAKELDEFVAKGDKCAQTAECRLGNLSEDDIADLQLQTARKLREVSLFSLAVFVSEVVIKPVDVVVVNVVTAQEDASPNVVELKVILCVTLGSLLIAKDTIADLQLHPPTCSILHVLVSFSNCIACI